MSNGSDNNTTNNNNKFPEQGNFSASQINNGKGFSKDFMKNTLQNTNNPNGQTSVSDRINNAATNVKKEIIKKGAEAAADAYLTPAGGAAVKAVAESKVGDKIAETLANNSDPITRARNKKKKKEAEHEANGTTPLISGGALAGIGCFGGIILVIVIIMEILSPILYIGEKIKEAVNGFWNKAFYNKLLEVQEEYKGEPYNITLNVELITATLTYTNPIASAEDLGDNDDLSSSSMINFRKSKKKIDILVENLVAEGKKCVDEAGNSVVQYKEGQEEKCPSGTTEKKWHYQDEDKYKQYLKDEFIRKFYFDNKTGEDIDQQIDIVIRNIFSRVEMVKYLNGEGRTSSNFSGNNVQVRLMNCAGTIELETISLYEYLQGILYQEGYATGRSEEFLKVQAIISKNYLFAINKATPSSIPTTLTVRNCQMNQVYCSVEKGCHHLNDGEDVSKYDAKDTLVSGDNNGSYLNPPIGNVEVLKKIKSAIDATINQFIVKDGNFVTTEYRASCTGTCDSSNNRLDQKVAYEMINSGSSYKDVLAYFYNGELTEITLASGYPLDIVYNRITSPYGWRIHPTLGYCKFHDGIDFGMSPTGLSIDGANIYSIADGVVILNQYSSTAGNYTIIGHGATILGNYEYYSVYMHQKTLSTLISVGSRVKAGQLIGYVGNTGRSTGSHLHFGIYKMQNGERVYTDPIPYFQGIELVGDLTSSNCQK